MTLSALSLLAALLACSDDIIPDRSCSTHADCADHDYCNDDFMECEAQEWPGEACEESRECGSGLCESSVCQPCVSDEQCAQTYRDWGARTDEAYCQDFTHDDWYTCAEQRQTGFHCERDRECRSGTCGADRSCAGCLDDSDCGDLRWCSPGGAGGIGECLDLLPSGAACERDTQCGEWRVPTTSDYLALECESAVCDACAGGCPTDYTCVGTSCVVCDGYQPTTPKITLYPANRDSTYGVPEILATIFLDAGWTGMIRRRGRPDLGQPAWYEWRHDGAATHLTFSWNEGYEGLTLVPDDASACGFSYPVEDPTVDLLQVWGYTADEAASWLW